MRVLKIVSMLGFGLVGTFCLMAQASEDSPKHNNISPPKPISKVAWNWGKTDASGLQLGAAQLDRYSSTVLGLVRNHGAWNQKINLFGVGRLPVTLQARLIGATQWTTISLKPKVVYSPEDAEPSAYKVVDVKVGQNISFDLVDSAYVDPKYDPAPITIKGITGYILSRRDEARLNMESTPWGLPYPAALPTHTFTARLLDYAWPADWNKTIEIKLSQSFASDAKRPSFVGTLQSGSVFVAPEVLRPQTLPSPNAILEDVKLEKSGGENAFDKPQPATISVERFITLMKTATPMSDEEYANESLPGGFWHRGTFRIGDAGYRFVLGLGGVNYLATPNGTLIRFKDEDK